MGSNPRLAMEIQEQGWQGRARLDQLLNGTSAWNESKLGVTQEARTYNSPYSKNKIQWGPLNHHLPIHLIATAEHV